jgi:hypothetical protein
LERNIPDKIQVNIIKCIPYNIRKNGIIIEQNSPGPGQYVNPDIMGL